MRSLSTKKLRKRNEKRGRREDGAVVSNDMRHLHFTLGSSSKFVSVVMFVVNSAANPEGPINYGKPV